MTAANKSEAIIYKDYKGVQTALYSYVRELTAKSEILMLGIPHYAEKHETFLSRIF